MGRVALIAAYNKACKLLLGKRRDNGKWTMPGGHLEEGESPLEGAKRELFEETGLKADTLTQFSDSRKLGDTEIFTFKAVIEEGKPTSENDPDDECETWEWVDVSNGLPEHIKENCAGPPAYLAYKDGKANVLIDMHEMKKSEMNALIFDSIERLTKMAITELTMTKAEEHDEVDRLLKHPDHTERRMALKLGSVRDSHIIRALQDEDPEVQRAALEHPAVNGDVLTHLMGMPNREHLILRALGRDDITPAHLKKLYDANGGNNRLVNALTHYPDLTPELIDKIYEDGKGTRSLVVNRNANPDTIKKIIEKHFAVGNDVKAPHRYLAMEALRHPYAPAELVEHAFKHGDEGMKLAAIESKNLPEAAKDDVMSRGTLPGNDGEAFLRHALVTSPHATVKHLDMGLEDKHPRVRAGVFATKSPALAPKHVDRAIERLEPLLASLAMKSHVALPEHRQKLLQAKSAEIRQLGEQLDPARQDSLQKFQSELGSWIGAKDLAKATKPEHFKGIVRASDTEGSNLVDHKPHLDAHAPEHEHLVQAYREHILNSPKATKKLSTKKNEGITRKHMYEIPSTVQSVGGQKFMVKPYHERVIKRIQSWGKNPHQGWAEMANQSLYHAAGIGDLHQKVHVSEHNMGPGHEHEPALVVAMEPNHRPIYEMGYSAHRFATPEMKEQSRKIAMMDFLTNNLDRHGGNLMMRFKPAPNATEADKMLAIDHSRSFQYQNTKALQHERNENKHKPLEDNFGDYVKDSSVGVADPLFPNGQDMHGNVYGGHAARWKSNQNYAPTFQWWGDQSENVRKAMDKQLEQIKDPQVRAHIKRNFDERADWLDERANLGLENYGDDWYKQPVAMYRPHEMTDKERDFHNWYSLEHNNLEPDVKQMWRDRGLGHIMDQVEKKG